MKKYSILLACLALLGSAREGFAQNEADVLRYSRTDFGGTARTLGLSGASVALGGDAGTLTSNPAGLGLFRRSEVTVSAGLNFNNTTGNVYGSSASDNRNNMNIPQLGIVISRRKADDEEGDWRSGAFGIGFTRVNNFNQRQAYQGTHPEGGLKFAEYADQLANLYGVSNTSDYFYIEDLAFATGLIDYDAAGQFYYAPDYSFTPDNNDDPISRVRVATPFSERIVTSGSQNQWDFSYGASFRDKFFIGGSLGLTNVRFKRTRTYSEVGPTTAQNSQSALEDLTLRDDLLTEGSGVMLKVGAIFRPSDVLRLGVSVQTPTWYTLTDRYSSSLTVNFKPGTFDDAYATTLPGEYEYSMTTPFRASGGAAVFLGKNGFITADVEYVDYSNGRLSADDESFNTANNAAKNTYQSALNYRLGAEGRFNIFRVRGGFGYYGDPFKDSDVDQSKTFLTGGLGIKQTNYFIDAALVYSKYKSLYSPYTNLEAGQTNSIYTDAVTPLVESDHKNTNFVVTVGWNF
ncbi:hypothetical protein [Nibribacter koreensis]|uniref:Outer membrane protein transport protein n=1 Tax=Nibribacter koreensis TaxID=1084519 RepID=A0ABP8FUJ6_9BACT